MNISEENKILEEIINGTEDKIISESYVNDLRWGKAFLGMVDSKDEDVVLDSKDCLTEAIDILSPVGVAPEKSINPCAKKAIGAIQKISENFIQDKTVKEILGEVINKLSNYRGK